MKILQVTHSLGNGGAEKFIVELSNHLARKHEVLLCTYKNDEPWMLPPKNISASVKRMSLGIHLKKKFSNWLKSWMLIYNEKPDIVHVHSSLVLIYMYFLPFFFRKIKFIQTIHNTVTPKYKSIFIWISRIPLVRHRWHHVCISAQIYHDFAALFPKHKFYQIDNGVASMSLSDNFENTKKEIEAIKGDDSAKVLIAIGNYSDFKRFDMLVEAFVETQAVIPGIRLIILGEDKSPNMANYQKAKSKSNNYVSLLGLKTNVADYLYLSDALVMSSSAEGMPLVILEAMAMGKPVISAPAGGIPDMITNKVNGFIAKDLSKEALITVILDYLQCEADLLKAIELNNISKYKISFSMFVCAANYENLYKGAL